MASLRDKTISGVFWSFLQQGGGKAIQLVTTIILARLLTPKDFGLIGMLTIFISVSQAIVQAGFNQALIQKKDTDAKDYSTVFYINLVASIFLYAILFITAPFIADFYDQPILTSMTRVLTIIFVINAFSYVQEAKLKKEMKFKKLMFIHLPSTIFSGVVAVSMAFLDFGVWSIVGMQLTMRLAYAIQIWIYAKWQPLWYFNRSKAKKLFSYGGNLMISSIIHSLFDNAYLIVIGKFFPVSTLGYYQNAKKLVTVPTQAISGAVGGVTFSSFSSIQDDNKKLKQGYKKVIQQLLFWLCPIFTFAAILAEPLFEFVLTDKWLPAVPFFQLLCVFGMFYPLNVYNLNIVKVKGRSDIFLKLEIIKKVIVALGIVLTIFHGVLALVIFQVINVFISYYLNSFYSGKFIQYSMKEQIIDILPILLLGIGVGGLIFLIDALLSSWPDIVRVLIGFSLGFFLYITMAHFLKLSSYKDFKKILIEKVLTRYRKVS